MNNTSNYNKSVIDHFTHPRNVGEIKNPDGVGEVGNPMCGDIMKLTIRIDKKEEDGHIKEYISDIKFKTFGCAAAIATSSVITEMAIKKTIDDALKITKQDVVRQLGELPTVKLHCSNLAADALHEAIKDYRGRISKS